MLVMRILPSLDHVFYAMLILVCITGPGKAGFRCAAASKLFDEHANEADCFPSMAAA
jgi:hypothetical protein